MERQSQHPSPQGLQTYLEVYSVKTTSPVTIHSPMWRWSLLKTGHFVSLDFISRFSFVGFWKKPQMEKKFVKVIGCRYVCYHICPRNHSFSLRQNISNLCSSFFVFLPLYYDKIFTDQNPLWQDRLRSQRNTV